MSNYYYYYHIFDYKIVFFPSAYNDTNILREFENTPSIRRCRLEAE